MKRALFFALRLSARTWLRVPLMFGGYRPERHYMRGPGPKWHALHRQGEFWEAGGRS
jgi:hypothetical protein